MTALRDDVNDFRNCACLPLLGAHLKKGAPKTKSRNFGHREIIFGM